MTNATDLLESWNDTPIQLDSHCTGSGVRPQTRR